MYALFSPRHLNFNALFRLLTYLLSRSYLYVSTCIYELSTHLLIFVGNFLNFNTFQRNLTHTVLAFSHSGLFVKFESDSILSDKIDVMDDKTRDQYGKRNQNKHLFRLSSVTFLQHYSHTSVHNFCTRFTYSLQWENYLTKLFFTDFKTFWNSARTYEQKAFI